MKRSEFREFPDRHDNGEKRVLGERGSFRAPDVADILIAHPATARRLAWRICDWLLAQDLITDDAVDALAAGLAELDLDIGFAVETVLRSQRFFSEENIAAKVLGPVDFAVGIVRGLELHTRGTSTVALADWIARMGQELFAPPDVGGWTGGRHWLDTRTTLVRMKFARAVGHSELGRTNDPADWAEWAKRHGGAPSAEDIADFASRVLYGCPLQDDARAAVEHTKTPADAVAALLAAPSSQVM